MTSDPEYGDVTWLCGAWQPETAPRLAFRCTLPAGHGGSTHRAEVDGSLVAEWPRLAP